MLSMFGNMAMVSHRSHQVREYPIGSLKDGIVWHSRVFHSTNGFTLMREKSFAFGAV
jgi:hypothetical protein